MFKAYWDITVKLHNAINNDERRNLVSVICIANWCDNGLLINIISWKFRVKTSLLFSRYQQQTSTFVDMLDRFRDKCPMVTLSTWVKSVCVFGGCGLFWTFNCYCTNVNTLSPNQIAMIKVNIDHNVLSTLDMIQTTVHWCCLLFGGFKRTIWPSGFVKIDNYFDVI